jgi:hypothetical protein
MGLCGLVLKSQPLLLDEAADEMGKKFMWDSLPPYLTESEKSTTVFGDGEFLQVSVLFLFSRRWKEFFVF